MVGEKNHIASNEWRVILHLQETLL